MRIQLFFIAFFLFPVLHLSAQSSNEPQCVSTETEQWNRENQAAFQQFKNSLNYPAWRMNTTPIIVPVVFHVVNNDIYVSQVATDAALLAMINRLNIYFAKQNADTSTIPVAFQLLAAASSISFCLAATDPVGNSTTGIVRVPSSHGPFYPTQDNELTSTALGGDDPWPYIQYVNIYICALDPGHLGFASHGHAAVSYIALSGTTLTHEMGHVFGLSHTWGFTPYTCSDDDGIADTPKEYGSTTGTPTYPLYDACTTTGDGIMYMNLMDYAQQRTMFTIEQVALMEYTLTTNSDYIAMTSTNNCQTVGVESVFSSSIPLYPNPAHENFTINITGELKIYDMTGRLVKEQTVNGKQETVNCKLNAGIYCVKVTAGTKQFTQKLVIE